ncbi:MAG: glycosyl transferase family 2 [Schlesneria sp.]|nr:glycosyl transferase family 2 [Schlesneria sp.]
MTRQRIALIFDDILRPETTGGYCLRALRQLHDVQHYRPQQLPEIPKHGFDLYLNIDDGLRYHLPPELRPCAWWVIDTHMDPEWAEEKGRRFDWLFAAQRNGAERLRGAGIPTNWLPLACDPRIHQRLSREKLWDICFVGRIAPGPRNDLLARLVKQFGKTFVGERYFEQFAETYSQAKIGFNRSVKDDVNMRVFETLACGPLLVTNDLVENGQEELLVADQHFVKYSGAEELLDKLHYYLGHDEAREKIAFAGHQEVIARHTYLHRMQSLLEIIDRSATIPQSPLHGAASSSAAGERLLPSPTPSTAPKADIASFLIDDIDFIIKTFLRPKALLRLLRSICEIYPAAHVSVADDGNLLQSADEDSRECCALINRNPNWTLYSLPWASGVTSGRNLLVDSTTRPFVLLLDDDFCFTEATRIDHLHQRLHLDPPVGIVAGSCVDIVGEVKRPRSSGGTLDLFDETLVIKQGAWRDQVSGIREYVPQFGLIRREVFADVRWDGGIGAEHYDFLLQLRNSRWKVVHDLSVTIDHYPTTETLCGYADHRFNYADNQQWLLRKWGLQRIVQDGQTIVERSGEDDHVSSERRTSPPDRPQKDAPYFEFARPEVVALIPLSAQRVLDIGCGTGRLGMLLKQRQSSVVTGIELNPAAAAAARTRLDRVLEWNLEDSSIKFPDAAFDCVVCADVLEHLRDPASLLVRLRQWLVPGGHLVISLPNVRHHSIVAALLEGNWTYEAAGLLDNDHVRFFTRREIEKLLFRCGFALTSLIPKPGSGHAEWEQAGRPGSVKVGALQVAGLSSEEAEEFFTYQYLAVARSPHPQHDKNDPNAASDPDDVGATTRPISRGLTSIIIVTFNELPYTRECVESIRLRTDEPVELIFVDNGSTDGTSDYLKTLSAAQVICNLDNRGFPAAVNQGLQLARGEQILLLNNDTVVSTGWLCRMLSVFERHSDIGLVGPCSNNVSGSQLIPAKYGDMASMDGFAWDWGKLHARETEPTDRLIGFCLLIRRAVVEQIGGLDERFGIGCFEDDDLCLRALQQGWKAAIARDAFVHHYGSRTFFGSGVDFAGLLEQNRQKFEEKWIPTVPRTAAVDTLFDIAEADEGGLLLVPRQRPRLSLCMIVRNNETTIGSCLESIRPWVDEMIVVDTGSSDATADICQRLGAIVHHWAWCDDFSAARNESVRHATGEWIFWMDSDDTIPVECGQRLRMLADSNHVANILGYVIQVHCPGPNNDTQDVTAVDHVKLFRNRPELRFEHRIHEQILPAIRRCGGEVAFTDIYVVHSGADHTTQGRQRKLERDFRLLRLDLEERPDHPFVLFNLGMTHADVHQHVEAVRWLERCLQVSRMDESHVRKAYALLISSLMQLRELERATQVCRQAADLYPNDKEILFRQAMLAHELGRLQEAVELYQQVLKPSGSRHFASVDIGLSGFKARHNLALVHEDLGQYDSAETEWRSILTEQAEYAPAQIGLIECLIRRQEHTEAEARILLLRKHSTAAADGYRMASRLAEAKQDWTAAVSELQSGTLACGDDPGLLRELARLHHASHDHPAALAILERLTSLVPIDASVWHNRGVVLGLLHRHEESESAFSQAAALR